MLIFTKLGGEEQISFLNESMIYLLIYLLINDKKNE